MGVPHLFMQTWKTKDVPKHWKESPASITKHCKGWTYVLMTDKDNEQFVKNYFPDFYPYYKSFQHNIQRVDSLRYMWLYIYGGVYMDLDFALNGSIDDDFDTTHDLFFVYSGNIDWCITNSLMGSKPGCPFWLDVLEELKVPPPVWCITKHLEVMNTTGPIMLNYCVRKYGSAYRIKILDQDQYGTCSVCEAKPYCKQGAKIKTLKGESWCAWDSRLFNYVFCNRHRLGFLLSAIILMFLLVSIRYFWTKKKRHI